MGEETCEIGHDILILVRAIDEQEVDGLIPSFRHLAAEAHNGLDVLREAGALNVMRKIRKQVGLWQVGATVEGVYREDTLFASPTTEQPFQSLVGLG